jgi:quercetin dioxygenase-like cupin family protein
MAQAKAQKVAHADPVKVDSKHYTVELENEKVRVLRIRYGPREKSQMHGHPTLVTIMLTDCHARFTYPDGKTEEITAKAGEVRHFPAFEHLPENLSDKPLEVIGVELKS